MRARISGPGMYCRGVAAAGGGAGRALLAETRNQRGMKRDAEPERNEERRGSREE